MNNLIVLCEGTSNGTVGTWASMAFTSALTRRKGSSFKSLQRSEDFHGRPAYQKIMERRDALN